MDVVRVRLKVVTDNTGANYKIPALLTKNGIYNPLVDYLLEHYHSRSNSWFSKVVYSIQLFMRYLSANVDCFASSHSALVNFSQRLRYGTIGDDGLDTSGLYWLPMRIKNVNSIISKISHFSDWLAKTSDVKNINPLTQNLSDLEARLAFAAWYNKNKQNFLGHLLADKNENKLSRELTNHRELVIADNDAIAFDEHLLNKFLTEGIAGGNDVRGMLRDFLIVLLMHGAGVRISDALHLWVYDVYQDENDVNKALVRLYHPEHGAAPDDWKPPRGTKGKGSRSAYLKSKYNLQPRNRLNNTLHVGWKTIAMDDDDNYINLHWFPSYYGVLFKKLWMIYLKQLQLVNRNHPYAFISFHHKYLGKPYTRNAFYYNYKAALNRIGLTLSKTEGRSPHAHRHSYGRRMVAGGLDPIFRKKALHHSNISSQSVYTTPTFLQISNAMEDATKRLDMSNHRDSALLEWNDILKHGFLDIDPDGLLSGQHFLLGKH